MRTRRKIRGNSQQPTLFWLKTKSNDADFIIPKFSILDVGVPVRIKFEDGSEIITAESKVDLSTKTGVKTIEYLRRAYSRGMMGTIFPFNGGFVDKVELEDYIGDLSSYNVETRTVSGRQVARIKDIDYELVDLDLFQNNGGYYLYDLYLDTIDVDSGQLFNTLRVYRNKNPLTININEDRLIELNLFYSQFTINYNVNLNNLKRLTMYYQATSNLELSKMLNLESLNLYSNNLTVDNVDNKIDVTNHVDLKHIKLQYVSQIDVLFRNKVYSTIYLRNNLSFLNIDKVIPECINLTVNSSTYKSITLTNAQTLKTLSVQDPVRNFYGNPKKGTDILNLQDAVNLEELNLHDNPQAITTYSDFSVMPNLRKLYVGGNGDGVTITTPPSLILINIKEFSSANTNATIDLSNNILLENITFAYTDYDNGERVTLPTSLNNCKYLWIRFVKWNAVTLNNLVSKVASNNVNGGTFCLHDYNLEQYNNTPYNSLPIDVRNLIDSCRILKQRNWTFNAVTNSVIKDNI